MKGRGLAFLLQVCMVNGQRCSMTIAEHAQLLSATMGDSWDGGWWWVVSVGAEGTPPTSHSPVPVPDILLYVLENH